MYGFVDDVRIYFWYIDFYLCFICIGGGIKFKILDVFVFGCCVIVYLFVCKGIDVENG